LVLPISSASPSPRHSNYRPQLNHHHPTFRNHPRRHVPIPGQEYLLRDNPASPIKYRSTLTYAPKWFDFNNKVYKSWYDGIYDNCHHYWSDLDGPLHVLNLTYNLHPTTLLAYQRAIKIYFHGTFTNPYITHDQRCSYLLNTNTWAESNCQMPSFCGEIQKETISVSWLGNKVIWCYGVYAHDNGHEGESLQRTGLVEFYELIYPYTKLSSPAQPKIIESWFKFIFSTFMLSYDGSNYYWIPSQIANATYLYFDKQYKWQGIDSIDGQFCHMTYHPDDLAHSLAPILIGPSMPEFWLSTLPFMFPALDVLECDPSPSYTFEWNGIGLTTSGAMFYSDIIYPQPCLQLTNYYSYNIPLLSSFSNLVYTVTLYLTNSVELLFSKFSNYVSMSLSHTNWPAHIVLFIVFFIHYRQIYLALILTITLALISWSLF